MFVMAEHLIAAVVAVADGCLADLRLTLIRCVDLSYCTALANKRVSSKLSSSAVSCYIPQLTTHPLLPAPRLLPQLRHDGR